MSTLLDERCMTVWRSPTSLRHVEGWFGETLCKRWIDRSKWDWMELTSVRYLGRIAQMPRQGGWCKTCINNYKDVDINAK